MKFLNSWEILTHECRRVHRCNHDHSPNYWMLFSRICNVRRSFLSNSHLIFLLYSQILLRHFPWRKFRNPPLLWELTLSMSRSIMNHLSVPYGMRISVEKRFFTMRGNLLHHIPRSFLEFPWLIVRRSSTFPLLRRPKLTIILATSFPGSWYPYEVLPGFDEIEGDTTEGILTVRFIMGLDLAVTRSSPDPCWARFAITMVSTVELKWLIFKKNSTNDFTHHAWNFLWLRCLRVGFLVSMYLIWIFRSRLIRTINQEQLCESWKHVSL